MAREISFSSGKTSGQAEQNILHSSIFIIFDDDSSFISSASRILVCFFADPAGLAINSLVLEPQRAYDGVATNRDNLFSNEKR